MASKWDPWRGCHKYSAGCTNCYIHRGDEKRGVDTNIIVKADNFYRPIEKKKNGEYKMPSGLVWLCFSSDFLIQEADEWRKECFKIMRERQDQQYFFITKRIERFMDCIPEDWGDGYENVTVSCTVENQKESDFRLSIFDTLPIKHKYIACQPLLEQINIEKHLNGIEYVCAGGESANTQIARPLDYDWILSLRDQCINKNVTFEYRQCGSNYIKNGITYKYNPFQLAKTAHAENLDFTPTTIDKIVH